MSDEKNALKLLGDQIDFNLNLIICCFCLMLKKIFIQKTK